LKTTDNARGINVFGKIEAYDSCAIGKAKKKKTNKVWIDSRNVPGERLYADIR
jgi:hypothetical protein